jgi:hypothetical protein
MSDLKMTVEVCGQTVSGTIEQFESAVEAISDALASVHDGETWAVHVWSYGQKFVELFFTGKDAARFALGIEERDAGYVDCVVSPEGARRVRWDEFAELAGDET